MKEKHKKLSRTPAFLSLAKRVHETKATGEYNRETDTWSNREFSTAATKKHNEAM